MSSGEAILLVEDNPDDAFLVHIALRGSVSAVRLTVVSDAEQAMQYIRAEGRFANRTEFPFPSLILVDLDLPRVHGFELLSWLREEPLVRHLPTVVLTGSISPAETNRALQIGADEVLTKPADLDDLRAVMKQLAQRWLGGERRVESFPGACRPGVQQNIFRPAA